ncbi:MAG: methyl-accepting chemotaxis protein [Actinobacteria bacterium]|nr:methyl-accepting chemotaxis protein [Actinomycetota bacterium]
MTGLGVYTGLTLKQINGYSDETIEKWLPGVQLIQSVDTLISRYRIEEYHYITTADVLEKSQIEQSMGNIHKEIDSTLEQYEKTIKDETDRQMFSAITTSLDNYTQLSEKALSLSRQGNDNEAAAIFKGQSEQTYNTLSVNIAKEVKYNRENGTSVSNEGDALYHKSIKVLSIIIVISGSFGLLVAFFISRSINNPLKQLEALAERLAGGDLTVKDAVVKNRDEMGSLAEAFNIMKNSLREVINRLAVTTGELSGMAGELSSQAQQTAAAAQESAATVGEIATTMDQVAQNAMEVASLSEESSKEAARGSEGVDRVTIRMKEIAASSDVASGVVESLSNTLNRVNQIVDIITSIAGQTNLLALNAAIEAARAGEQGRGFAVVAEEVRKLAEQSASAAKDISQLIGRVDSESRKAVEAMGESNERVRDGVAVIGEVGESFRGIIDRIEVLADQVQNVASASEQVSAGIQNVSASTEEQTAAMEEVSAATEQLNKMAFDLNELVKRFKL